MECAYHVLLLGKSLGSLAYSSLSLKVFAEVIFPCLDVEFQLVVELLHAELVVFPKVVCLVSRNSFYLFPLLLQFLEFLIVLVCLLRCGSHGLYLLYDVSFQGEVLVLLLLLFCEGFLPFFFHYDHLGFESLLSLVRKDGIFVRVASCLYVFPLLCLALSQVDFVENSLEHLHLCLLGNFFPCSQFVQPCKYFLLGGVLRLSRLSIRCLLSYGFCLLINLGCHILGCRYFLCLL